MPRKCTICSHTQTAKINKAIAIGQSLRNIAKQFTVSDSAVLRHTENCLSLSLSAFVEKKLEKQAIDVYKEFEANFDFARKLRVAAEEYLADPLDPLKLAVIPRADEIDVVYYESEVSVVVVDSAGKTSPLKPVKKTAKLSILLQSIEEVRNIEVDKVNIRHVDLRSFAIDAIRATDLCADKFAKLGGHYQRDKENEQDVELARLKASIEARAADKSITYDQELENYLQRYAGEVRADIRDRLVSELGQVG